MAPLFGERPEFLDLHYKIQPAYDHVAKFHDDRPRELGGIVARYNKKLSYCWETVRRESMPRITEMDVEMTT